MDEQTTTTPPAATPMTKEGNSTLMAVLAYLGPLVIISYLFAKDDPFVKFHIKQGLILLILNIIVSILMPMMWTLWQFFRLLDLALVVLTIIGIVNALQKKEKEVPFVGSFASHINI